MGTLGWCVGIGISCWLPLCISPLIGAGKNENDYLLKKVAALLHNPNHIKILSNILFNLHVFLFYLVENSISYEYFRPTWHFGPTWTHIVYSVSRREREKPTPYNIRKEWKGVMGAKKAPQGQSRIPAEISTKDELGRVGGGGDTSQLLWSLLDRVGVWNG